MYLIQNRISVLIHFRLPFIKMARPQEKVSVIGRISSFFEPLVVLLFNIF